MSSFASFFPAVAVVRAFCGQRIDLLLQLRFGSVHKAQFLLPFLLFARQAQVGNMRP